MARRRAVAVAVARASRRARARRASRRVRALTRMGKQCAVREADPRNRTARGADATKSHRARRRRHEI